MTSHDPGSLPADAQPLLDRHETAYPGEALREPALDDLLYPQSIPPGFRQVASPATQ